MNLSKTSDYAIRILTFMASDPDKMYTAANLIKTLSVSDKYLRRIMTEMTKGGLIQSIQGREGGYRFSKKPENIYLNNVVDLFEGMDQYRGCILGFCDCNDANPCALHHLWGGIRKDFVDLFTNKTILEIAQEGSSRF